MIDWHPITKEALLERIAQGVARMSPTERRLWKMARIDPVKWSQDPYGIAGQGFWVVAVIGTCAIWYNDIEDGFNRSRYWIYGQIQDYWCNQDELDAAVRYVLSAMDHDTDLIDMPKPEVRWRDRA